MIVLTNTAPVVLTPGQALTFNDIVWKSGCAEMFRNAGSSVRVSQGIFEVDFNGNITNAGAATAVQLNIAVDGSILPETTMISTPAVTADFNNVSASTIIGNRGNCCNNNPGNLSLTVVNSGTTTVTVAANSKFSVKRVG